MENAMQFFNNWAQSQEKFVESWAQTSRTLPQMFPEMELFKNAFPSSAGHGVADHYSSWLNELMGSFTKLEGLDKGGMEDTLLKMTGSSNVYKKFYDTWLPIFQAVQQRVSDSNVYRELLDPVKQKEVLDAIFLFNPDVVTEFIEQTIRSAETFGFSAKEFWRPWTKVMEKNMGFAPDLLDGRPDGFLNVFHNLFNTFDNTIGKVFHIPAVGKDREKIDLMMRSFDDLTVFCAKSIEYQHRVYSTGIKAVEKILETITGRIKSGEDIKTFDELFNLWIDVNEQEFYEVFKTEEFSRLQGEFLDAYLKVRRHFHKLMELYLFELPVALRSEMDDVYKTVYELKKKVRSLERQMINMTAKEVGV